jgi:hypothetical protein
VSGYSGFSGISGYSGPIGGTGTLNYLAKFSADTTLTNSLLQDDGTNVSIAAANGRSLGITGLGVGMTVTTYFGDSGNNIVDAYGSALVLNAYNGLQVVDHTGLVAQFGYGLNATFYGSVSMGALTATGLVQSLGAAAGVVVARRDTGVAAWTIYSAAGELSLFSGTSTQTFSAAGALTLSAGISATTGLFNGNSPALTVLGSYGTTGIPSIILERGDMTGDNYYGSIVWQTSGGTVGWELSSNNLSGGGPTIFDVGYKGTAVLRLSSAGALTLSAGISATTGLFGSASIGTILGARGTTTPQFSVEYNVSNYLSVGVSSLGLVTYTAAGASAAHTFGAQGVTMGALTATGTTTLNGLTYTWPATRTNTYVLSTDASGNLSWVAQTSGSGGIGGSGTANYIGKFSASTTMSNSSIQDNGSLVTFSTPLLLGGAAYAAPTALAMLYYDSTNAYIRLASYVASGQWPGFRITGKSGAGSDTDLFVLDPNGYITAATWHGAAIGDSYIASASTWNAKYGSGANVSFGTGAFSGALTGATSYNGLVITPNTGVVTTGTWQATAITDTYISSAATWSGKQAAYANLTSIGALANAVGWLRNDGSGNFSYAGQLGRVFGLVAATGGYSTQSNTLVYPLSYTLPANSLVNVGDSIRIQARGRLVAGGNGDFGTIAVYFGGTNVCNAEGIIGVSLATAYIFLDVVITRTGASAQQAWAMTIINSSGTVTTALGESGQAKTDTSSISIQIGLVTGGSFDTSTLYLDTATVELMGA